MIKPYYQRKYPIHWLLNGLAPNPNIGKYAPNRKPTKKRKGRK